MGALHYAKLTDQISGTTRQKWNDIFRLNREKELFTALRESSFNMTRREREGDEDVETRSLKI